jgi:hypothetical protein
VILALVVQSEIKTKTATPTSAHVPIVEMYFIVATLLVPLISYVGCCRIVDAIVPQPKIPEQYMDYTYARGFNGNTVIQ